MSKYNVPAEKRAELDALSKEVYGASSRWVKLMEKGRPQVKTQEMSEVRPVSGEDDKSTDEERTVKFQVPVHYFGAQKSVVQTLHRLTLEEVETEMRARKDAMDKFRAHLEEQAKKEIAAKAQAELEAQVARELSGSAV